MDKKVVFVINDFYGHGGHVKSFIAQIRTLEHIFKDIKIICSETGYIVKNLHIFDVIQKENLVFVELSKIRRWQFSLKLMNVIKSNLMRNSILHVYSPECYFSALVAKSYFQEVVLINFVMGGPNPFPCLRSTDLYVAVSQEQRDYAIEYSNMKDGCKISMISNRIKLNTEATPEKDEEKIVLVVSRFDNGLQSSLKRIFSILEKLPTTCKIVVAGTGDIHEEYRLKYKVFKNINFIGYCNDLMKYKNKAGVVLGMGRSILEFMLHGVQGVVVGHNGIEILERIESVKFASSYNFAGRKILNDIGPSQCAEHIISCIEEKTLLSEEVIGFLKKEYLVEFFKDKYLKELSGINASDISKIQIIKEYFFILNQRVKRKIKAICNVANYKK